MAAGMHLSLVAAAVRHIVLFCDRQGIHVAAESDGRRFAIVKKSGDGTFKGKVQLTGQSLQLGNKISFGLGQSELQLRDLMQFPADLLNAFEHEITPLEIF